MILGLAIDGKNQKAADLFSQMEKVGPRPNAVAFVDILTACNHKSLFNEVWWLFGRMSKVYGISPSIELYGWWIF